MNDAPKIFFRNKSGFSLFISCPRSEMQVAIFFSLVRLELRYWQFEIKKYFRKNIFYKVIHFF
jgi:hypothetical protein